MKMLLKTCDAAIFCLAASLLSGCAGDLKDARESADKAASFVGSMQETTMSAIDAQRTAQQMEMTRVAELQAEAQANLALSNQYRSTWHGANLKDPQELYKALVEMTPEAELPKSAPFILMTPTPEFVAPAIDRKSFTDLIANFSKLAEGLSPIERAKAAAPFIKVIVKSYQDSVKGAKSEKPLVAAEKAGTAPLGTALTLNSLKAVSAEAPAMPADAHPIESLSTNEVSVNGLLSSMEVP
jgi:hypothetical protein